MAKMSTQEIDSLIKALQGELDILKSFSNRVKEDILEATIKQLREVKEEIGRLANTPPS